MLYVEKAKIYGVDNVGSSSPAAIVRTDDAVGKAYSIGASEIASDFDGCYPYNEMREVVDEFGNVFIKIPKFYHKITRNTNGTYKHQISGVRYGGFGTLFVDGKGNELDYILVGKYEASGSGTRAYSKSGQTVLVNITQEGMRNACRANGAGYQQYDFLIDLIIKELFLVEFATTNTQAIMRGYVDGNSAALTTGHTDVVKTASGSETSNSDGHHACKYRGIENPTGNVWSLVDGVSFDAEKMYVCYDPTEYETAKHTMPYKYVANRPTSEGYARAVTPTDGDPLLTFTSALGGGEGSYYCDYFYYNESGVLLTVGGAWSNGSKAGLWLWYTRDAATSSDALLGGRLCYKPL